MELNTLEDIQNAFPNDETARKWLAEVRWGKWASCPYCGNSKAYFIENGSRYKCANNKCYKKFSVTVKTVLEGTNLQLHKWLIIFFVFVKKRGKPSSYDLEQSVNISAKTAFMVFDRIEYGWQFINREGSMMEVIKDMFRHCVNQYERFLEFKHSRYYKNPYHISEITDISDEKQYNLLIRYIKYYIDIYAKWIFNKTFAHPREIMSEVFLYMKDNNIKEYNAETILKHIWHTINVLWFKYVKDHPNLDKQRLANQKLMKRDSRINLRDQYIIQTIKNTKNGRQLSVNDIRSHPTMIKEKREKLLKLRKKIGRNFEFESHFS